MKQVSNCQEQVLEAIEVYRADQQALGKAIKSAMEDSICEIIELVSKRHSPPIFYLKIEKLIKNMPKDRLSWFPLVGFKSQLCIMIDRVMAYNAQDVVIERLREEVSAQQATIAKMAEEHQAAMAKANAAYRESVAELAQQLHDCRTEIGMLKSTLTNFHAQMAPRAEASSEQIASLQSRVVALNDQVAALDRENAELREQLASRQPVMPAHRPVLTA